LIDKALEDIIRLLGPPQKNLEKLYKYLKSSVEETLASFTRKRVSCLHKSVSVEDIKEMRLESMT